MRHATLFGCSTAHLPVAERRHIDHLIAVAPRGADGRVEVGHPDLVIEPYAYGFFVHTCVVGCGGEAPDISPEFWAILKAAFDRDASWVLRSEEHTSELQSLMRISYAVFCLKKQNKKHNKSTSHNQNKTYYIKLDTSNTPELLQ